MADSGDATRGHARGGGFRADSSGTPSSSAAAAASGSSQTLDPGAKLGTRYVVESLIGQGGMGRVYKAYDQELDRSVAIKVLQPELTSDPEATQRFKQELLLASRISHKNILRIHDLGEAEGLKFISMAFVDGQDLHHLLKAKGRLPPDRILPIARQLCDALGAAHAEGVVHRDLKPQNILIGKSNQVFVSDFGLAKSLEATLAGMTRTGAFLGTPRYMSPEQVEGKPADHRTDIYALGLILYEMATGDVPFQGDSSLQVMYQRVKEKPKNPKELNPNLPDFLSRIILRCLEREPERRYQSAQDVLADLEAARPPAAARTVRIPLPALGRRGWLVAGAGVVVALATAFSFPQVRNWILRRPMPATAVRSGFPPLSQGRYLAVIPFRIVGDQKALGYIADGLVEALSAKLFHLQSVHMTSSAVVEKVNPADPLDKVARNLGVNLVVDGMVQGAGNRIRIIVNLEDIAGGRRLWSQEFSGLDADLLTLEDQIYSRLVNALQLRPTGEEFAQAAAHPTENLEAYDLYLRGRNAMRGQQEVKNVQAAINFYTQALGKDSRFALAYAGLADASLLMYHETKQGLWAQRALGAAQQAQQLNDKLPEVHFSLGAVYNATGKTAEAIAELRRALQLAPNSDEGYRRLGAAYLAGGQKAEAIAVFQKAVETNPYYWVNQNALGNAYFTSGEYEKALRAYRHVTDLEPENAGGYENVGAVFLQLGKYEEAIPAFEKALTLQPYWSTYSNLGFAYFNLKNYPQAVKMFEKAAEMNPNDEVVIGNLADAYRWSGQKEKAVASYNKAIALAYKELEVNPRKADTMGSLALYYAKKGDAPHALDFIRRARSIDRTNLNLIYTEAVVQNLAHRPREAIKTLGKAFAAGYPTDFAAADPELGNLQKRPDFVKLLREFGPKAH